MAQKLLRTLDVWLIGVAALLLYGATAAPGIAALYDDSLEFQLIAPTFAIAHPTGYPLYTLLGGLWSRLIFPFGNWAWRMNLFSALAGGATVALLYLLAKRLTGGNRWAGLAAACAFALSPVWWSQTTIAEVYALHNFFVAALLYAALFYAALFLDQKPSPRQMAVLCGLAGLSLTHHRTAALLLPGLALYLLWTRSALRRPQAGWLGWGAAFLAPLLLYLYIPVRSALGAVDLQGDYVNSWSGFWRHVLASGYTGFFTDNSLAVERAAADWLALAAAQFGWIPLALGGIGLLLGLLRRAGPTGRAGWGAVWLILIANLLFAVNYRVADAEVFWLPIFFCIALGVGNGVAWLIRLTGRLAGRLANGNARASGWAQGITGLVVLAVVVAGMGGRGAPVNRGQDWDTHNYAFSLARTDFPPNSRVVGLRGQMTALQLVQASTGVGVNAQAIALDDPAARRAAVEESVAAGLPVYLTQEVAGIEDAYSFSGEGVLVRVWPRGEAHAGAPTHPLDLLLAEGALRLLGYDWARLQQPGAPAGRLTFYWQPATQIARRLKLSLRWMDEDGALLVAEDRYPLRQVASTSAWLPGEVVRDVHDLPLPVNAVSLLVIVYDDANGREAGRFPLPLP